MCTKTIFNHVASFAEGWGPGAGGGLDSQVYVKKMQGLEFSSGAGVTV